MTATPTKSAPRGARYSLNKNKYLLIDELIRLRKILESFEAKDPRNVLMIEIALNTGARAQELLNITRNDVIRVDKTIYIRGIKGSNDREIPLQPQLFDRFYRYLENHKGAKPFEITYDRLYQIWDLYRPVPQDFSLAQTYFCDRAL